MTTIEVAMSDGTTHILHRLLSAANHKQRKGKGFLSVGLTLTPRATGRSGLNLCPHATRGCSASCFSGFDRMAWPQNKRSAVARTRLLASDPHLFFEMLQRELEREQGKADQVGRPLVCRLNVVSDYPFERACPQLFTALPRVQFMDYTKSASRMLDHPLPTNYHLTFSRSETNEEECQRVLTAGHNITVVFRKPPFPRIFWGFPAIDGDSDDFRFLDPSPCVVGLKAKGKGAREDSTGFVVDPQRICLL